MGDVIGFQPPVRGQRRFACPFCASAFDDRAQLDSHWRTSPLCFRNRMTSNATASKYGEAGVAPAQPGANVLRLVRRKSSERPKSE